MRTELPRLYFIADVGAAERSGVGLVEVVRAFLSAGGRLVSLRGTRCGDDVLVGLGREISALVASVGGIFLVHRRVDVAMLLDADGVHLPASGLEARQVRMLMGRGALVGRSCHDRGEVMAHREESDLITLGPLFESISKEGYGPQLSAEEFQGIVGDAIGPEGPPIYALGGIRPENVARAFECKASGVAVIGGIMSSGEPGEATERYLRALGEVA